MKSATSTKKAAPPPLPAGLHHANFVVMRTPLESFQFFTRWADVDERSGTECGISDAALLERLVRFLARREVSEAIYLGSQSLYERYYGQPDPMVALKDRKLVLSLTNYLARMTTGRAPFGLFSGTSVVPIGAETQLQFSGPDSYRRRTRVDLRTLEQLLEKLNALEPWNELRLVANNTAYVVGPLIRYVHWSVDENGRRYELGTAEWSEDLAFLLEKAKAGATYGELLAGLREHFPVESEKEGQVSEEEGLRITLKSKLLMPAWQVQITGGDPIRVLSAELNQYPQTRDMAKQLTDVANAAERLDACGITGNCSPYREMQESLKSLGINANTSGVLKVDLFKPLQDGRIAESTIRSLMNVIVKCQRLLPPNSVNVDISERAERFERRFGESEVPLTMALDDDCSNFPTRMDRHSIPAVDKLGIKLKTVNDGVSWSDSDKMLMRLFLQSQCNGSQELVLTNADLRPQSTERLILPPSFVAKVTTLPQRFGDEQGLILDYCTPVGAKLSTRSCYDDEQLEAYVREYIRREELAYKDCIVAELVHVPSTSRRAENIVVRPILRQYEIAYAGRSGVPIDRQIPISDIWIALRRDRFVLRSASLGKEIIVLNTTGHNIRVEDALTVYWFLSQLQYQGVFWSQFSWSRVFEDAAFLPRVRMDNVILSLAQWHIDGATIDHARSLRTEERLRWARRLREDLRLPRYVSLGLGEHALAIDLENQLSIETLLSEVDKGQKTTLAEATYLNGRSGPHGPEGDYCADLLIPMLYERSMASPPEFFTPPLMMNGIPGKPHGYQAALPGSEWLFVKIYCGVGVADQILTTVLPELTEEAIKHGAVDHWFFLRYRDPPDFHIRVRFYGTQQERLWMFYLRLRERIDKMHEQGFVARVALDTYQREIIRYGGLEAVEICERLFHIESNTVCKLLNEVLWDVSHEFRLQVVFASMDQILTCFEWGHEWSCELSKTLASGFASEFDISPRSKAKLSELYRTYRPGLIEMLLKNPRESEIFERCRQILNAAAPGYLAQVRELRKRLPLDPLDPVVLSVVGSLLHMCANRLFPSKARMNETVVYDFLARTYRSLVARNTQASETLVS